MKCPKCDTVNPDDSKFCKECATSLTSTEDIQPAITKTIEIPREELTTGSTFAGRYQIVEELGKGGMGKVYKALDTEINTKVALKLIKNEVAADEKTIERFRNELKNARDISHKNVCRMYDLNKDKGTYYITMEYIPGEDLKSMIRMMGQLSAKKTIFLAKQVCEGLAEAHSLGIIHRDLKPQNIMVDRQGNAKIMDFGIARSVKSKGITDVGVMIGTPEYMSPEQVEGKAVNQTSDIYSLGVILYEMLTGRVPFEAETPLSVAVKHKTEMPRDPKELNEQIPDDLSTLVLKCLEKEQLERHKNVEEIFKELARIETGIPTTDWISPTASSDTGSAYDKKWESSIAVLPFIDLSPEKDQDYFCDGLAEELINVLSKIDQIRVVARTSAFLFKSREIDICEIGKKLKVETVLEGSVRKSGNRLRITAQLISTAGDYHIWSERYDREMDDVFVIQDEITLAVVKSLKVKLLGQEEQKLIKRHTVDVEAHNAYLKGLFFWNKRTESDLKRSIEYFEQAAAKDPDYALALTGLANAYLTLPIYSSFPPAVANQKAKEAAEKAVQLDNSLSEAHTSLALLKLYHERDWDGAEEEFESAIKLNSGNATALNWYASEYLTIRGRFNKAIGKSRLALELDPLSLIINRDLGMIYYYARQYDEALQALQKTIEMETNFIHCHGLMGLAYLEKAMFDEALIEFEKEQNIFPDWNPTAEIWIGYALAKMGKTDEVHKLLDALEKKSETEFISPYFHAGLYIIIGENDQGFLRLEQAFIEYDSWLNFMKVDPILDSVRSDSRFKILLKKMNLD